MVLNDENDKVVGMATLELDRPKATCDMTV